MDLRSQIGLVTQETMLFNDTIYENIRYGNPNATKEQIEDAARQAHAMQFISQLPDGFQTVVGEKGGKLSGMLGKHQFAMEYGGMLNEKGQAALARTLNFVSDRNVIVTALGGPSIGGRSGGATPKA